MPYFICPNCGNRELSGERTAGFSTRPKGCSKCGFGFLFELLDDYMPAPGAAFFTWTSRLGSSTWARAPSSSPA